MGSNVHVVQDQVISSEGVIRFSVFLKRLRAWCKAHEYRVIYEDSYEESEKAGLKSLKIKWHVDKKIDDYHKYVYKFEIMLDDYQDGHVDGVKVEKGKFSFKVNADMELDYDDKWSNAPWQRFWRGVVDRFVRSEKEDRFISVMRAEVDDMQSMVRAFLG